MRLLHTYAAIFGWRVRSGPFRGLRYVRGSVCSTLAPKLLGTYETELAPWIERLIAHRCSRMLNLGAAEGYYAVGFARRSPGARVVAFETQREGRMLIGEMAGLNGVADRVTIEGECTSANLASRLGGDSEAPLLIVDIEGGENNLLDPDRLPALRQCPMLIELHESIHPTASILRGRFTGSHAIEECWTRPRTLDDLPPRLRLFARLTSPRRFVAAMNENRPGPMRWFLCWPRAGRS